eukprot:Clim_evm22s51 gene=Clim_evmTU22s51
MIRLCDRSGHLRRPIGLWASRSAYATRGPVKPDLSHVYEPKALVKERMRFRERAKDQTIQGTIGIKTAFQQAPLTEYAPGEAMKKLVLLAKMLPNVDTALYHSQLAKVRLIAVESDPHFQGMLKKALLTLNNADPAAWLNFAESMGTVEQKGLLLVSASEVQAGLTARSFALLSENAKDGMVNARLVEIMAKVAGGSSLQAGGALGVAILRAIDKHLGDFELQSGTRLEVITDIARACLKHRYKSTQGIRRHLLQNFTSLKPVVQKTIIYTVVEAGAFKEWKRAVDHKCTSEIIERFKRGLSVGAATPGDLATLCELLTVAEMRDHYKEVLEMGSLVLDHAVQNFDSIYPLEPVMRVILCGALMASRVDARWNSRYSQFVIDGVNDMTTYRHSLFRVPTVDVHAMMFAYKICNQNMSEVRSMMTKLMSGDASLKGVWGPKMRLLRQLEYSHRFNDSEIRGFFYGEGEDNLLMGRSCLVKSPVLRALLAQNPSSAGSYLTTFQGQYENANDFVTVLLHAAADGDVYNAKKSPQSFQLAEFLNNWGDCHEVRGLAHRNLLKGFHSDVLGSFAGAINAAHERRFSSEMRSILSNNLPMAIMAWAKSGLYDANTTEMALNATIAHCKLPKVSGWARQSSIANSLQILANALACGHEVRHDKDLELFELWKEQPGFDYYAAHIPYLMMTLQRPEHAIEGIKLVIKEQGNYSRFVGLPAGAMIVWARTLEFARLTHGLNLISDLGIRADAVADLENRLRHAKPSPSMFQREIEGVLIGIGAEDNVQSEMQLASAYVDIMAKINGQSFAVEADGPTHYCYSLMQDKRLYLNAQTLMRQYYIQKVAQIPVARVSFFAWQAAKTVDDKMSMLTEALDRASTNYKKFRKQDELRADAARSA